MDGMTCDSCGAALLVEHDVRYEIKIEVKAAYDPMELTDDDLNRDHEAEIKRILESMKDVTQQQAMDQVYRAFKFDLCPPCQKQYLKKPLP